MNTDESHSGRGKTRDCDHAFTLIELVAVIATLAILAVWVMPALARSGDDGSRAVCYNNLRQMGTAVNMYASENQDGMAWPNWGNDASPPCPAGWLYKGAPNGAPVVTWQNERTNRAPHIKEGVFWQYVPDAKSFVCPVDKPAPAPALWTQRENKLSTYVMNGAPCYYPSSQPNQYGYKTCKISEVYTPLAYLMWEPDEALSGVNPYNDAAAYPDRSEGVGRFHVTGANVLAVGGHVTFIKLGDFAKEQILPISMGRNLLWWSPRTANGR